MEPTEAQLAELLRADAAAVADDDLDGMVSVPLETIHVIAPTFSRAREWWKATRPACRLHWIADPDALQGLRKTTVFLVDPGDCKGQVAEAVRQVRILGQWRVLRVETVTS